MVCSVPHNVYRKSDLNAGFELSERERACGRPAHTARGPCWFDKRLKGKNSGDGSSIKKIWANGFPSSLVSTDVLMVVPFMGVLWDLIKGRVRRSSMNVTANCLFPSSLVILVFLELSFFVCYLAVALWKWLLAFPSRHRRRDYPTYIPTDPFFTTTMYYH